MQRLYIIIICLCVAFSALAQTQQGIVKTRGRMVNGKLVAGTRLTGATVTLNFGNPLVSGDEGGFSFNVPSGKKYSLVTAQKQGYTLADPDYTRRSFSYSNQNPFYVVLEDVNQRQADINAATRKVQRTMNAQLEQKDREIEELKNQNKITEEEYQRRIKELYEVQDKSQQLVKEMAERYVSTDYDQLDAFQQQVQQYIEEGELLKADSMIQSKGSIDQRVEEYHQAVAANKTERERLEQSEAATAKTYQELSDDLYNKHTIALQQYEWDDALKYLKQRADLDTTNVGALREFAVLCYKQHKDIECETYWKICLNAYSRNNDFKNIAELNYDLGILYKRSHNHKSGEIHLKMALEIIEPLFQQNPNTYGIILVRIQNSLSNLYLDIEDYKSSEKYSKLALWNCEQFLQRTPNEYRAELARIQSSLAQLYSMKQDYTNAEKYYKLSIKNRELLIQQDPKEYRSELAVVQHNLGSLYNDLHDYSTSEKYFKLALEHYEHLFHTNPDVYRLYLAMTCRNIMLLYANIEDMDSYDNYLQKTLDLYSNLYTSAPQMYKDYVIDLKKRTVWRKLMKGDIEDALSMAKETYAMDESNGNSKSYLALCYNHKAYEYANASDFANAYACIDKAISLFPTVASFYDSKGEILLMEGKNQEALAMWKKVLELNPDFLKDYPDGTNLSNGLKKLGLIE